jgi:hypothetical protein
MIICFYSYCKIISAFLFAASTDNGDSLKVYLRQETLYHEFFGDLAVSNDISGGPTL